jgi:hypothetical protein
MKSKEQFQRNQEMSIEDAIENFRELVTASDAPERKYLVVITVNKIGYNFNVDASNHEEALQCALQNYKVSPYPQVGTAYCIVYGICKNKNCDCGYSAHTVFKYVTL